MNASLPADGGVRLGSVLLPEGKQISGWTGDPLLWATSEPVPHAGSVWLALHDMQEQTGLVPILLAGLSEHEPDRPWDSGELDGGCGLPEVDRLDPADVLASTWADSLDPEDDSPEQAQRVAPFSLRFPGLAPGQEEVLSPVELAQAVGSLAPARVGLVRAAHPADVLALVGYNGTANRYGTSAPLVAVLRSWEQRFGAVLLEVGFDHVRLLVERPPRALPVAQAAAAEIWAMCDEFWAIEESHRALRNVSDIADCLIGAPFWSLWLD
jgi:Domain of unknown function (DUF4253)